MLSTQYYFLISGLPDLYPGAAMGNTPYAETLDDLAEWVSPADACHLRMVRYPFDNFNAISLITNQNRPFDSRGTFSRVALEAELKSPADAPDYLFEFVTAQREGKQIYPGRSWEDQLNELYYMYIAECGTPYLCAYSTFDRHLRNGLAARNLRESGRSEAEARRAIVIGDDDVTETIIKSSAPDLSLSAYYAWADALIATPQADIAALERQIDQLRFAVADELVATETFGIAALQAFSIKLGIMQRWSALDTIQGRARFETHLEHVLRSGNTAH